MPEDQSCPHCGAPIAADAQAQAEGQRPDGGPKVSEQEKDLDLPPAPLLAPGSHDDDFLGSAIGGATSQVVPDPNPGKFSHNPPATAVSKVTVLPVGSSTGEGFPAINLGSGIASKSAPRVASAGSSPGNEEEEEVPRGRRTSWSSVLLASYASAITLGLAWTLMKDRNREAREPEKPKTTTPAPPESARQAGLSRKIERPEPIVDDHLAMLGRPLKVGDLEVTPIDVKRQDVTLQRSTLAAKAERKAGGRGALVLRLKLKNTSGDSVFAPLDQAYVRERGKEVVDTFLLTADQERVYPFPLAVESEWSILGQDFAELRPGESKMVSIVTAPDAPPDASGPFTWRVRLRTGINRTDVIGLRWPELPKK